MIKIMKFKLSNLSALEGDGLTPDQVQDMIDASIAEIPSGITSEEVINLIDDRAQTEGYDDTIVRDTKENFPNPGTIDVLYIAANDGSQYIWNGSNYELLMDRIEDNTIDSIIDGTYEPS